jgi:hypothetical protein
VGQLVDLNVARQKRSLPLPSQRAFLEERILSLVAKLDEAPAVVDEIIALRNRIWLLDAASGEISWPPGH